MHTPGEVGETVAHDLQDPVIKLTSVLCIQEQETAADYYFDSYAHFGESILSTFLALAISHGLIAA